MAGNNNDADQGTKRHATPSEPLTADPVSALAGGHPRRGETLDGAHIFSIEDEARIAAAISEAETRTSGEIVAVVAAESDAYAWVPYLSAALVALLVPWPLIYFTGWSLHAIYVAQLLVFFAVLALTYPRAVRIRLVPPSIKELRAKRRGVEQFLAQDLHTTASRTGVLIFVSMAERYAAVLADAGISDKVSEDVWQTAVDVLVRNMKEKRPADGFTAAIDIVATELATHFPPGSLDTDELPNHLIVLV